MAENSSKKVILRGSEEDVDSWVNLSGFASPQEVEDEVFSGSLRPASFKEYVGQENILENLKIACDAASRRKEVLDHVLLHGPPGLGKTSLSRIIAGELGVGFKSTSGPVVERPGDLAAILTSLDPHDVLFIDEIHRLPRVVEEVLYPAMEDFELNILIGQGPAAKSVKIELKPFTLVGATTESGLLTSPLRSRFGLSFRLNFYEPKVLAMIVKRSATLLGVEIDDEAAYVIGKRSRGTPRIANRLLKRVRDFADQRSSGVVTTEIANHALEMLEVDDLGLDLMDRLILNTIKDKFEGGPVGIETIAAAIGEERETIEEVYEPYLVQEGLVARTRRGRELTALANKHLETNFGKG